VMKSGKAEGKIEQDFYGRVSPPFRLIGKMITPNQEEQERNPRSRSVKLRIAEKI
jgi:16S rRNA (cytosine1402-N4)-methyltransferase